MKASAKPSLEGKTPSQQIDAIIMDADGWKGRKLSQLRALIKKADPAVVEEVKWKMPSRPSGVPVWSHGGIICVADLLKNAVRLTFPKGAQMKDPKKLFNTRLDSKTVRAIDFFEEATVDEAALKKLILVAAQLNTQAKRKEMKSNTPALPKLAAPAQRALASIGVADLRQLSKFPEAEVAQLHGMGPNALNTLHEAMKAQGLSFKQGKTGEARK